MGTGAAEGAAVGIGGACPTIEKGRRAMRMGIDLGGTKTEIIALDKDGSELLRRRIDTPTASYEKIVETICELVQSTEATLGRRGRGRGHGRGSVGIGIPGAISPSTGRIKNANTTCLIGKPFDRDLEIRLGRPVRLANDANCFALSEATDGAAAGAGFVFG